MSLSSHSAIQQKYVLVAFGKRVGAVNTINIVGHESPQWVEMAKLFPLIFDIFDVVLLHSITHIICFWDDRKMHF